MIRFLLTCTFSILFFGCGGSDSSGRRDAKIFPSPNVPPHTETFSDCRGDQYLSTLPIVITNELDFRLELHKPNEITVEQYVSVSPGDLHRELGELEGSYVWAVDRQRTCSTAYLLIEIIPSTGATCWMDVVERIFASPTFPLLKQARRTKQIKSSAEFTQFDRDRILKISPIERSKVSGNYILITKKNCLKSGWVFDRLETVLFEARMHARNN